MPEVVAALITALVGLVSSGALAAAEQQLLGGESIRERAAPTASGFGPFTWAWGTAVIVGIAAGALVFFAQAPSESDIQEGAYDDFFATSAQITAALIIALAIEAGQTRGDAVTAFRLEACACVALGALAALAGLVPGLPRAVYAMALMMIPPGVVGGLVGVVAIAVTRRRDAGGADAQEQESNGHAEPLITDGASAAHPAEAARAEPGARAASVTRRP